MNGDAPSSRTSQVEHRLDVYRYVEYSREMYRIIPVDIMYFLFHVLYWYCKYIRKMQHQVIHSTDLRGSYVWWIKRTSMRHILKTDHMSACAFLHHLCKFRQDNGTTHKSYILSNKHTTTPIMASEEEHVPLDMEHQLPPLTPVTIVQCFRCTRGNPEVLPKVLECNENVARPLQFCPNWVAYSFLSRTIFSLSTMSGW
jgi:hypothetical protein